MNVIGQALTAHFVLSNFEKMSPSLIILEYSKVAPHLDENKEVLIFGKAKSPIGICRVKHVKVDESVFSKVKWTTKTCDWSAWVNDWLGCCRGVVCLCKSSVVDGYRKLCGGGVEGGGGPPPAIDECALRPQICGGGDCLDTPDGYICQCHPGFTMRGHSQVCEG